MALCELCRGIPFDDLPPFLDCFGDHSIPLGDKLGLLYKRDSEKPFDQMGLPYHLNLESLRCSAEADCPLCSLVHEAAGQFCVALDAPPDGNPFSNRTKNAWVRPVDYRLRMVKMKPEDNGLFIFADANRAQLVFIIASIHISVDDDSELANIFHGRKISDGAELPLLTRRLQTWIDRCTCPKDIPCLPTRVLDVGDGPEVTTIRLWETGGAQAHYVTLSHCWGGVTSFITTRESLEERQAGIAIQDMPMGFQDAVTITRKLGIRYLWIDSLCIIQQDAQDWEQEGYKMDDIYSKSYLTIALASAPNDNVGCLHPHPVPSYTPFSFQARSSSLPRGHLASEAYFALVAPGRATNHPYRMKLESEPLSSRAWTFQERALSTRTVFFCSDQVHFECLERFQSEDGFCQGRMFSNIVSVEKSARESGEGNEEHLADNWHTFVSDYSKRSITYESDRLPALSGITKRFAQIYHLGADEFVAGLWKRTMLGDLLWMIIGNKGPWPYDSPDSSGSSGSASPRDYHAPTWSWTCCPGAVGLTSNLHRIAKIAEVVDLQVSVATSNPFGRLSSAQLALRGPRIELFVDEQKGQQDMAFGFTTAGRKPTRLNAFLDYQSTNEKLKKLRIFVIFMGHGHIYGATTYVGILVTSCLDGSDNYRRLGLIMMDKESLGPDEPKTGGDFPVTKLV